MSRPAVATRAPGHAGAARSTVTKETTLERESERSISEDGLGARLLRHASLEPSGAGATPLDRLETTDRHRLGLLLQGCALLAHLERAGWYLERGWQGAQVCEGGTLRVQAAGPGRSATLPQARLRELTAMLFRGGHRLTGKGEARRVARRVLEDWGQDLERVPAESSIETLLREAPFLWEASYAVHRRALAAEMAGEGEPAVWIAGPAELRRKVLEGRPSLEHAWQLLEADGWCSVSDVEGGTSAGGDGVRPAVADTRVRARAEIARGRFLRALALLRDRHDHESRLMRLDCQVQLGRLPAAKRTLRLLTAQKLRSDQVLELADLALRVHGNLGERDHARDWVARALEVGKGPWKVKARVIAALASWDRGEVDEMRRQLAEAERCGAERGGDVERDRSYLHARGLLSVLENRPEEAATWIARALSVDRRLMARHVAGRLWNDLVFTRLLAGDLAGAERGSRHCLRLLGGCDGPVKTTLALYNLAEARLRRGRLSGIEDILERCRLENALSGNVRGSAQDAELWARYELARGRPQNALNRCAAALERLRVDGVDWSRAELELLASRALGWLGRAREAGDLLGPSPSPRALALLDAEERPALLALAGLLEAARESAAATPAGDLFCAALDGRGAEPRAWLALDTLEPYRAARAVFDLHLLAPQVVPEARRRWAAAVLCGAGADGLAERLEILSGGFWLSLHELLASPRLEPTALARLFAAAGHREARLERSAATGEESVLLAGAGGSDRLEVTGRSGSWRLHVARRDESAEALLRLVDRLAAPHAASDDARSSGSRTTSRSHSGMIGESPALLQALDRLERLARLDLPVLVLGETGTGKELAARHLHRSSGRRERPFLAINCAALSETLVLSDLFGHSRGAFTGADRERPGVFESAEGGTVFLDEVGDLPLPAQGMLLRVLQDGEVRRLGEPRVRRVDVRVVAATHRDLERMVAAGAFREDLYYRLRVGRVTMPPLRDRAGDALLLAQTFVDELGGLRLSSEARASLQRYAWPGNVRQLRAVLEAASTLVDDRDGAAVIEVSHLDLPSAAEGERAPWHDWLDRLKRERLRAELEACGRNQAEVARRLGLTRQALSYLVRQLGLTGEPGVGGVQGRS